MLKYIKLSKMRVKLNRIKDNAIKLNAHSRHTSFIQDRVITIEWKNGTTKSINSYSKEFRDDCQPIE